MLAAFCAVLDAGVQLANGGHWPSDLIGAWLIGGLCGFAVSRSAARLSRAGSRMPLGE